MAGRMSPLFQLWFSMTFPDQEVCKSTIIGTELVTTVECQRQCGVSSTVCNVGDSVQCPRQCAMSATENQLLVENHCQLSAVVGNSTHSESLVLHYGEQFVQIVTKIPWFYNHFHDFPWRTLFSTTFEACKTVLLNSRTFHDFPWPGDTLGRCG